jgi:hypothetical protein
LGEFFDKNPTGDGSIIAHLEMRCKVLSDGS